MHKQFMQTRAKICGLARTEDVACAIAHGASFLGFIVEAPSQRRLTVSAAARLAKPAKDIIPTVAVTVNADDNLLSTIVTHMAPNYIQCHGDETPQRMAEIARKFNVKTIKACAIADDADMKAAEHFSGVADLILYDARPPAGSNVRGGHGISIDWDIIARAPTPKNFMLAGGLTPNTVRAAIAATCAPIVDVSSGVEAAPGIKDPDKIKAFMEAVNHG